jgi:SAM-dependent methyltransferase
MTRCTSPSAPRALANSERLHASVCEVYDRDMTEVWERPSKYPVRPLPDTIENDWNAFYWDFPDVYDRFSVNTGNIMNRVDERFAFGHKVVADVGSGTGRSTFEIAKKAQLVIGIEPWAPMRQFAIQRSRDLKVANVAFVDGVAQGLPLADRSVDIVITTLGVPLHLAADRPGCGLIVDVLMHDALRAVRRDGVIIHIGGAPNGRFPWLKRPAGWTDPYCEKETELLVGKYGFDHYDVVVSQDYASVEEAVQTCGFIYGHDVIKWLRETNRSHFQNRIRIYSRPVS